MTTLDFVIDLFIRVDDAMKDVRKHSQAKLYPSELVTLGLLYAIKGDGGRAFWRWADRDLRPFFLRLSERTRLFHLLATHQDWADHFLADLTYDGLDRTIGEILGNGVWMAQTYNMAGLLIVQSHVGPVLDRN